MTNPIHKTKHNQEWDQLDYRVVITALDENNEIYEKNVNIVSFKEIYKIMVENIDCRELFPNAIIKDVRFSGHAQCWCGSKGYGYKISPIED